MADGPRVVGFDPFARLADWLEAELARVGEAPRGRVMRFGYWLPVFGGWLRNVDDEAMEATWEYVSRLARRSEQIGFDLTLVAELI